MHDGILSQEEIDALLRGDTEAPQASSFPEVAEEDAITEMERDALGELGNIAMGTAATTLSSLLHHKVSITTPQVMVATSERLQADYPVPCLLIEVRYTRGLSGTNVLIIKKEDAVVIADLMMGGNGTAAGTELDEIQLSAVGEAMNQMMGSATTSLSSMFDMRIDIDPPRVTQFDMGQEQLQTSLSDDYEQVVQIKFAMKIEDLLDSEIMQIIPLGAARDMVASLMGEGVDTEASASSVPEPEPEPEPTPVSEPVAAAEPPVPPVSEVTYQPSVSQWQTQAASLDTGGAIEKGPITVQPLQFAPLTPEGGGEIQNIGLIMDVPLDISVELGKTKKTIKEILELGPGSIIQLDKLAGEPVDLLVNGKLIARGEVVVIDESYGIRVTAIISPIDRMSKLQ